jgi:cation diffusion facilitator family transporter
MNIKLANQASWLVNWFLLFAKLFIAIISNSKAMYAALADSIVDLLSQSVLSLANNYMNIHHNDYPVGRSKLEALSVLACSAIMTVASIEVIQYSIFDLYDGFARHEYPDLSMTVALYAIVIVGIVVKFFLYIYCQMANAKEPSDSIQALAEDHLNDIFSNTAALISLGIAIRYPSVWWLDPVSAIVISCIIIYRWMDMISEQVKKIIGYTAPQEFIDLVNDIASKHDSRIALDCTRAYHFGSRFNVEMEIILPADMTVQESHDIALALQHKIEELSEVERAFVHVDHLPRDGLEHKIERELVTATKEKEEKNKERQPIGMLPFGIRLRLPTQLPTEEVP